MEMVIRNILIGAVLLISAGQAMGYPPENAAVLYYKTFLLIMKEPNDADKTMLRKFCNGNTVPNESILPYLKSNQKAIKEIITAAEIKNCDWGIDLSEGFSTLLPPLDKLRYSAYLLSADAKILAEKGDYKTALERCITMHKLGRHVGDEIIVQRLVGIAIGGLANRRIMEILPTAANDTETLQWLRVQLADISSRELSLKMAIGNEVRVCGNSINKERLRDIAANTCDISGDDLNKLRQIFQQHDDNDFYNRSREYYQNIIARVQIAFDLPYPQAKQKMEDLYVEVQNDANVKPEAFITRVYLPAIHPILTADIRGKTQLNATLAGIDIYIIRAKTGKLPDEMPEGLPKDLFSSKDFIYEKTASGFTLKCQGKDEVKNIFQQYEFKIAY
jgi:hypothetical protein